VSSDFCFWFSSVLSADCKLFFLLTSVAMIRCLLHCENMGKQLQLLLWCFQDRLAQPCCWDYVIKFSGWQHPAVGPSVPTGLCTGVKSTSPFTLLALPYSLPFFSVPVLSRPTSLLPCPPCPHLPTTKWLLKSSLGVSGVLEVPPAGCGAELWPQVHFSIFWAVKRVSWQQCCKWSESSLVHFSRREGESAPLPLPAGIHEWGARRGS